MGYTPLFFRGVLDRMRRLLERTLTIPLLGLVAALTFGSVIYPMIGPSMNHGLSTDGHDRLGLGLYHHGVLSFYPSTEPTVLRGTVYPSLVETAITLGGENNLGTTILILQALMHAITVLLAMRFMRQLLEIGPRKSTTPVLVAGILVALHPYLLWYLARVVVEPVSIMLCTALLLLILRFSRTGYVLAGLLLGIVTGLSILTKSTYILFLPLIPLLLLLYRRANRFASTGRILLSTLLLPILIVFPWTLRNYAKTDAFIPVHILDGVNFAVGDHFVESLPSDPLGYGLSAERFRYPGLERGLAELMEMPAAETVEYDRSLRRTSLDRYRDDPLFLVKKVALQSITFWTHGSKPLVTVVVGGVQLVALALTVLAGIRLIRREGYFSRRVLPLWGMLLFWLAHTPLYAIGRFSVVLLPVMLVYSVWWWSERGSERALRKGD